MINEQKKYICYLDCLGTVSFLKIWFLNRRYKLDQIRYCAVSRFFKILLAVPLFKKIIFSRWISFSYEPGHIFTVSQESVFWTAYREDSALSLEIMNASDAGGYFVNDMPASLDKEKIRLFLTQKIFADIEEPVRLILVARYYKDQENSQDFSKIVVTKDNPWMPYVQIYGEKNSAQVVSYASFKDVSWLFLVMGKYLGEWLVNLVLLPFHRVKKNFHQDSPKIAIAYLNGIDFDKRNDLFWLPYAHLKPQDVLIYFKNYSKPLTLELEQTIRQRGWNSASCLIRGYPVFVQTLFNRKIHIFPTTYFLKGLVKSGAVLLKCFLRLFFSFHKVKLWQLGRLGLLLNKINFYEALFKEDNVKIHCSLLGEGDDSTAATFAIGQLGGVDVSTQWSNFPILHITQITSRDVYFCWGPHFEEMFKTMPRLFTHLIQCGYIYDSTFKEGKIKAARHRKILEEKGARFIVTFFDEQVDKHGWVVRSQLESIYARLFLEVLKDQEFGLIIKSKRANVFKDITGSNIKSLLEKAMETQRCLLLTEGQLPNEAALASDVVIGYGAFNTAVLESALAGIPFLTVDFGGLRNHPFYQFGFNKIVFNDLDLAMTRLREFYQNPKQPLLENRIDFQDYLKQIDPFQDQRAAERVGFYIKALHGQFLQGLDKKRAIEKVNALYRESFGGHHVIDFAKNIEEYPVFKS